MVKNNSDVITIRVSSKLKKNLLSQAKNKNQNLNQIIREMLEKQFLWDSKITEMGYLPMNPNTITLLLDHLTINEIKNISKKIAIYAIEGINHIFGEATFENTMNFIINWLKDSNMIFKHIEKNNTRRLIVTHKLGKKWSIFIINVVIHILSKLGFVSSYYKIGKNQYIHEMKEK